MTKKEKYAYIAGLIDGEGCLEIGTHFNYYKGVRGKTYYSPRMCVCMCDREPLDFIVSVFGKKVCGPYNAKKRLRPLLIWRISGKEALQCVAILLPYLQNKAAQARALLTFPIAKSREDRLALKNYLQFLKGH